MHIALVNQWYPPESGHGGVAMHNYYFANACSKLGHKVTVISNRPSNDTPAKRCVNGVTVLRVPSPDLYRYRCLPLIGPHYRVLQALIYSWRVCRALADLHRQAPVDVVEFADVNAEGFFWKNGLGSKLAVRCQTPAFVLQRYYTSAESPYNPVLLGRAEKQVIRRAQILFAPSRDMAEVISRDCQIPVERFHVIPDALDIELFSPNGSHKEEEGLTILFVGRLERAKGIEVLAEVIPLTCLEVPNVRFVLVGGDRPRPQGGSHRKYLEDSLKEYVASGQVGFEGLVTQSELIKAYQQADICVVPSVLYESFSFTCAQAMACGVPVIASAIGGIPETIGNDALLVEPGNGQQLAERILWMAKDKGLRRQIGRQLRERAKTHFGADKVARENLSLFEEQLGLRKKKVISDVVVT